MVDDYAGYKPLVARGVTELACWAHVRRKFRLLAKSAIRRGWQPRLSHDWSQHQNLNRENGFGPTTIRLNK